VVKTEIQEGNENVEKSARFRVLYTVSTLEDTCTGMVNLAGSGK
jgi:hypothetical protein